MQDEENKVIQTCDHCDGKGFIKETGYPCPSCNGKGYNLVSKEEHDRNLRSKKEGGKLEEEKRLQINP